MASRLFLNLGGYLHSSPRLGGAGSGLCYEDVSLDVPSISSTLEFAPPAAEKADREDLDARPRMYRRAETHSYFYEDGLAETPSALPRTLSFDAVDADVETRRSGSSGDTIVTLAHELEPVKFTDV